MIRLAPKHLFVVIYCALTTVKERPIVVKKVFTALQGVLYVLNKNMKGL